jgi:hypothetical protein
MEITVYDNLNRRVVLNLTVALTAGILAAFSTFFLMSKGRTAIPAELYALLIVPAATILALFALIRMMTSARIRFERATGQVVRYYFVFGREVQRKRFHLSDFDRVSLSRAFRAGYRVSLVGRDLDLAVSFTANLAIARDQADKVAAECQLKVSDQV